MTMASSDSLCGVRAAVLPRPKTISVNGRMISRAAIAQEVQNHPAPKAIEAWQAAARALVVRELLLQEARRLEIMPEPLADDEGRRETDEEAVIRILVEREVNSPEASDEECRRYHAANQKRFRSADLCELRHILLPAAPDDAQARANAKVIAAAIIAGLQRDESNFDALALAHSACPSAKLGGRLGQIGSGQTVSEFEQSLAGLPEGKVAPEPVESRYGLHVVQVDRRIAGQDLPFEAVSDRLRAWLGARSRHVAIRQYIGILAGRAEIAGIDFGTDSSPLVQ